MKRIIQAVLILVSCSLVGCAGNKTETTLNITGSNNTISTAQTPTTNKTSKTDTEVSGSGYGDVAK